MSYRRVKIGLGGPVCRSNCGVWVPAFAGTTAVDVSFLRQQIGVFRVPLDIALREGADRDDLQSLTAGGVENTADQRRAGAAALERLGNLRMEDGQNAIGTLVIRERDVSVGIEFEAVAFGVVANVTRHVTISAQSRSNRRSLPAVNSARCSMPNL